jgi:transposase-like protein
MINHKVKSHRGRGPRAKIWALSIVDTSTIPSTGYVEIVENRTKEILLPKIIEVVREGSIIHTDEWASYRSLNENFEHYTVVHKYNFVSPVSGVHTQFVESFNNKIMLKIKEMKGLNATGRSLFTKEFCFLDTYKDSSFEKLLEILAFDYN